MFRQFFDTSFQDYRQVRVVVQELPSHPSNDLSTEFQRFCTSLIHHQKFTYEQFQIEYCYVKSSLITAEMPLSEIQFYRRPFAFIYFTLCQTSEQLRIVLDEYSKIKQRNKDVYVHLFVRYQKEDGDPDDLSNDERLSIDNNLQSEYSSASRPSISSMVSVESYSSLSHPLASRFQDSGSIDGSGSTASDRISLTESISSNVTSSLALSETGNGEGTAAGVVARSVADHPKSSRFSIFKDKNISATNLFQLFDGDVTRVVHHLEAALTKHIIESENYKSFESYAAPLNSQLADIRLMIECEKACSLLENQSQYQHGYLHDRILKYILNEFDMRVMLIVLNQYLKANANLPTDSGKAKIPKKLIDLRTIKRKADCCLLLGAIEKAYNDLRSVADAFKSQNDNIWHAATLEARIAASYVSTQKTKRAVPKTVSFLGQSSMRKIERFFNRSNTPIHLQDKMDSALQIYNAANRGTFNPITFRFELDLCLRWCSLLYEQNDAKKYQKMIDLYITRINRLGSYLQEHIDSIYLNAYLAETYAFLGLKRKSALYYRSAAFSGLLLMNEQGGYNDEINFFVELIKQARIGYGIDDNRLIFPLIQKAIINESIQINLKKEDFTTIIQNVHFAIESLIEYMSDPELEALLTFLNASEESIPCSYCCIPRIKSLELLPLSSRLKAWKAEPKDDIFIYHRVKPLPIQHQSLHRKVDFFWVKNEQAQIVLEVENYLPSNMVIDQLEFLADNQVLTNVETKYRINARMKKRLVIDCTPKEVGQLRIQGLRYHIWSTNQEFRFGDYPTIRHCTCSIDVIDELPILDLQHLLMNDSNIEPSSTSTVYNTQVYRGEEIFLTLELLNTSNQCPINTLEIQALISGVDMTASIKILDLNLPIPPKQTLRTKLDLTGIYDRYLSRQYRLIGNLEMLNIEFRLNYSNELTSTEGYYRRTTIDLCLNYRSPITFQLKNIEDDEDEQSYRMLCMIENHLSEGILFENQLIKPSEISTISIKQDCIQINPFPSNINQLISSIRTQLPKHISYKTVDSNKQLRIPMQSDYFSNEILRDHCGILLQSPFLCSWHFEKLARTLHIHLCVQGKCSQLDKLEFLFVSTEEIRFLNSHKILFENIELGQYFIAERVSIISSENPSNTLAVDVNVNGTFWTRLNLNF